MEVVKNFIRENALLLAIAAVIFGVFAYSEFQGNEFCDCATTETYRPQNSGNTYNSSRIYHK
jgi:hypothetical protein